MKNRKRGRVLYYFSVLEDNDGPTVAIIIIPILINILCLLLLLLHHKRHHHLDQYKQSRNNRNKQIGIRDITHIPRALRTRERVHARHISILVGSLVVLDLVDHKYNLDHEEGDRKDGHQEGTDDPVEFDEVAKERVDVAKEEEGSSGDLEVVDGLKRENSRGRRVGAADEATDVDVGCYGEAEVDSREEEHECPHLADY